MECGTRQNHDAFLAQTLSRALLDDRWHRAALDAVRSVAPAAWITGGFVRNCIWDLVFACGSFSHPQDVDVIYLGRAGDTEMGERGIEEALKRRDPEINWSVRDQGRMHVRGGDLPYDSLSVALRAFPDRASAIAVRRAGTGELDVLAPYGLEDAFKGVVRPTPISCRDGRFERFVARKLPDWRSRWPAVRIAAEQSQRRGASAHILSG
jgi:hypothetical protein